MARFVRLLALASAAAAASLNLRRVMHDVQARAVHAQVRDTSNSSNPCQTLSQAYETSTTTEDNAVLADIPPSVAMACLRSVPVDKTRDLELLDYLAPFISFQSTIEILDDPPEGYLIPGVDILGGLATIRQKLEGNEYDSQYDVMLDLQSIFVAASDGHFNYSPALLNVLAFARQRLDLISISSDGLEVPEIYMRIDVTPQNADSLDYEPSPIELINGINVTEFLERDAVYNIGNPQDPDAQFNNLFTSIPGFAVGQSGTTIYSSFEIPDNYTVKFRNGSSTVLVNQVIFLPGMNFTGIDSGEAVHEAFEVPPTSTSKAAGSPTKRAVTLPLSTKTPKSSVLPGYPYPVVKDETGALAGYFLNGTGYDDTVVFSILSFLPLGASEQDMEDSQWVKLLVDGRKVFKDLVDAAKEDGRNKLIIDLSINGGGSVALAHEIYRLLFPKGEFTLFDRMRANSALSAASLADYDAVNAALLQGKEYPLNSEGNPIKTGEEWFGPYVVKGQNVTTAFVEDVTKPLDGEDLYYNGYDPENPPVIKDAPFTPENILVVTDGTCASACNILTGILSRSQGVKTLALGGRPLELPMQAMGGTKGTQASQFTDLVVGFAQINETIAKNKKDLEVYEATAEDIPSAEDAPLLPMIDDSGSASVNANSGYTLDDLEGYPVQFRYEAANCRLFYTALMAANVTETWRRGAEIAWKNGTCVPGSTVNKDGTIGNKTVAYSENVKSTVPGMPGPGSLQNDTNSSPNGNSNTTGNGTANGSNENGASQRQTILSSAFAATVFALMIMFI